MNNVRFFLKEHFRRDADKYFGVKDNVWLDRVTENWFDDEKNYDGRWEVIKQRRSRVGKVLDMASGCGTYVLYGLKKGYDVWGIEPEQWKREYFRMKVEASKYPGEFLPRVVCGVGEALPFGNESFDVVTTYQTLEHVKDVNICVREMLRVLKPEGVLYIRAPDYRSFYEGHYRIPCLPIRNRTLFSCYLKILGRPLLGLQTLNFITEGMLVKYLKTSNYKIDIVRTNQPDLVRGKEKLRDMLPLFLKYSWLVAWLDLAARFKYGVIGLRRLGRAERNIGLWVTKY